MSLALLAKISDVSHARETRATSWTTLLAGIRYVWANKILLGAISLDLFAVLLGGAVALLPAIARNMLHTGPMGLGFLRSAPAIGASLVAVYLAHHPLRKRAGVTMFVCVGFFGLATVLLGLSRSFWVSMLLLVSIGGFDMVSVIVRQTLVQIATPAEMRGRVSAVNSVFIGASNELGDFESGLTAQYFGLMRAVVVGGVGTVFGGARLGWALSCATARRFASERE